MENKAKKEAEKVLELDERDLVCIPIAEEFIRLYGAYDKHNIGRTTIDNQFEYYNPLAQQFLQVLLDKKVKISYIGYINQLVLQALDATNQIVVDTMNKHMITLQTKTFGDQLIDLTIDQIDTMLKSFEQKEKDVV